MKKFVFILITFLFPLLPTVVFSQNPAYSNDSIDIDYVYNSIKLLNEKMNSKDKFSETDYKLVENEVKDLNIQIAVLSNEISNINSKLAMNNKSIVENYIEKLTTIEQLNVKYKELSEDLLYEINSDNRLAFIADINNPGSDLLGFKFTDIIQNAALETVSDSKMTASQKTNFNLKLKNVVSSIYTFTSHGFTQQLASLNPAANATITMFNFLANYYVSDFTVTGFFSKSVEVTENQLFTDEQLEKYLTSIEDFIVYYNELTIINQEFKLKLNQLSQDFTTLNKNIEELDSIITINNEIINKINYTSVTNNEVFAITSVYSKTLETVKKINDLLTTNYQTYITVRQDFYTSYIEHIEKSEELLKNDLVEKANKSMASKNRTELIKICDEGKAGLNRYTDDFDSIKTIYEEIW